MNSEKLFEMIGYADDEYIMENQKKEKKNLSLLKKCVAGICLVAGLGMSILTARETGFGVMGGTTLGSMYYDEISNKLYYSGKDHNIYVFDSTNQTAQEAVHGAGQFFAVYGDAIYYTYKEEQYRYDLRTTVIEETELPDYKDYILYSDAVDNTKEADQIVKKNEDILGDTPYALIQGNHLYVAHNRNGGFIAAYSIEEGVVDPDSEQILPHTYTNWQALMSNVGTVNGITLAGNLTFMLVIPLILIGGGVKMLFRHYKG